MVKTRKEIVRCSIAKNLKYSFGGLFFKKEKENLLFFIAHLSEGPSRVVSGCNPFPDRASSKEKIRFLFGRRGNKLALLISVYNPVCHCIILIRSYVAFQFRANRI